LCDLAAALTGRSRKSFSSPALPSFGKSSYSYTIVATVAGPGALNLTKVADWRQQHAQRGAHTRADAEARLSPKVLLLGCSSAAESHRRTRSDERSEHLLGSPAR
jgi:hypothetical protein